MSALAHEHLTDLQHQLHTRRLTRDLRSRTTPPELARLTHVLARYHDQIADGFGIPHPASASVRDGAHRASTLIKQAEHLLGPPAETETPRSALAQKLRAASIALGCGLDLLATHFPVTTDQAITADAGVIAAPDTARSLLRQLSTHTATLGHLAGRADPPANQAGPLLLKAAVLARIYSENQTRPPINVISVHHIPDRIPPQVGESGDQALAGITASIHRLSNPTLPTSVTTWRYLARAAAIICDLNRKTVRQLIHRINELDKPDQLPAIKQAATDLKKLSVTWRSIVRRWDEHIGHYGHPANGPASDASDLIIRLGRLLHTDPAWTPSSRASTRVKPPQELAPTLTQAAELATTTLKAVEACNHLATHHHAAINDAAAIGALNRQKKYPTHLPRVPGSARDLSAWYENAQNKGHQAITTLAQAIQHLTPPSIPTPDEVRLIVHRTPDVDDKQSNLSAAEFPESITSLLNSPHTPLKSTQRLQDTSRTRNTSQNKSAAKIESRHGVV
ncbi:hypothetical protein [Actinomadura chokoriensis]|uniref:CHAD domain-containing protein n=1 Tax=Actinomadura chokoriensis TaxID=454156 RepID=A0ABV4R8A9_9ACTN